LEGKTLGSSSTVIKEALHELLGVDEDLFANVFYSEQDELRRILQIKPEERKVFIESILGFEYLKDVKLNAKHASDGLQNWLDGFMSGNIKTAVELQDEIGANVQQLKEQLGEVVKQASGLKDTDKKRSEADSNWSKISQAHLKLSERVSELKAHKTILEETLDGVATGTCPTCMQAIPRDLMSELIEKFNQSKRKIDSEFKSAKAELETAREKLLNAQQGAESLDSQAEDLAGLDATREELGKQLDTEGKRWDRLKKEVRAYENKHTVVRKINEEKTFLAELQLALEEFRENLRKSVIVDLENGVNFFMGRFSDGDFDARLTINDEFGFDIVLHNNPVPLFNLSGAARDILALSIRYALYKIASKEVNFLLLDEPTHHFDQVNTFKLKDALNELGDQQLIVITVHDEFFDAVGKKFTVEKDDNYNSVIRELPS
jgi:DNA repair exonuclease SbcCD ATPase subunit